MALETTSSTLPEWDEIQCKTALGHLDNLQEQLDGLRQCIPQILELLHTPQPTPGHLVKAFQKTAVSAAKDINDFKIAWEDTETKKILERADQSFKKDPDLTPGYQIPAYGWAASVDESEPTKTNEQSKEENKVDLETSSSATDDHKVIEEYRTAYPKLKVHLEPDSHIIKIGLKSKGKTVKFVVSRGSDGNGHQKLEAECIGSTAMTSAINRCISTRPNPSDLRYLLDMIAAFESPGSGSCRRCGKLVDDNGLRPAARRLNPGKGQSSEPNATWEAFHEGCVR